MVFKLNETIDSNKISQDKIKGCALTFNIAGIVDKLCARFATLSPKYGSEEAEINSKKDKSEFINEVLKSVESDILKKIYEFGTNNKNCSNKDTVFYKLNELNFTDIYLSFTPQIKYDPITKKDILVMPWSEGFIKSLIDGAKQYNLKVWLRMPLNNNVSRYFLDKITVIGFDDDKKINTTNYDEVTKISKSNIIINPNEFLDTKDSYGVKSLLKHYAQFCLDNKISNYIICNECEALSTLDIKDSWAGPINSIKESYKDLKLGISTTYEELTALLNQYDNNKEGCLLNLLDFAGYNCYPNMSAKGFNTPESEYIAEEPTLEECIDSWRIDMSGKRHLDLINRFADKVKKDLYITECGCQSIADRLVHPGVNDKQGIKDFRPQTIFLNASLNVMLKEKNIAGFFIFDAYGGGYSFLKQKEIEENTQAIGDIKELFENPDSAISATDLKDHYKLQGFYKKNVNIQDTNNKYWLKIGEIQSTEFYNNAHAVGNFEVLSHDDNNNYNKLLFSIHFKTNVLNSYIKDNITVSIQKAIGFNENDIKIACIFNDAYNIPSKTSGSRRVYYIYIKAKSKVDYYYRTHSFAGFKTAIYTVPDSELIKESDIKDLYTIAQEDESKVIGYSSTPLDGKWSCNISNLKYRNFINIKNFSIKAYSNNYDCRLDFIRNYDESDSSKLEVSSSILTISSDKSTQILLQKAGLYYIKCIIKLKLHSFAATGSTEKIGAAKLNIIKENNKKVILSQSISDIYESSINNNILTLTFEDFVYINADNNSKMLLDLVVPNKFKYKFSLNDTYKLLEGSELNVYLLKEY